MRMNKDPFENRLEALFAQPPEFNDTAAFAMGVERRLASLARWRADLMSAAWISTVGAVLWALISSLDTPTGAVVTAQAAAVISAAQDFGGGWLLPALAVGLVLCVLALEDQLARD
jgi:hypothetical protein